jgi:hypothetical protein
VAKAQHTADELEREDVEAAAARARAGEPLGTRSGALAKAKAAVELAQRDQAAIRLAQSQAEADITEAILASGERWRSQLGRDLEQARKDGRKALEQLRAALERISNAAATTEWVNLGLNGRGFDQPPVGAWTALTVASSARRTANSAALNAGELVAFLGEAIDPPAPTPRPVLGGVPANTAA